MRTLLKDAWSSNARDVVEKYYELGRRDAALWLERSAFARKRKGGGGGMFMPFL